MRDSDLEGAGDDLTVAVVGCGLIGGSIGLAVRRRWPKATVVGVDTPAVRKRARTRRAIGRSATRAQLWRELDGVDVLVLATSIETIAADVARLPRSRGPLTIDVGSVKGPIIRAAAEVPRFVGGHPMAGSERGGIDNADATLLEGRTFVLTPAARTQPSALRSARRFVTELGAHPLVLDADTHDRCVALTSHLPHLLSRCLMQQGQALERELHRSALPWRVAAGSWRDATRVAVSSPGQWDAIFAHNRGALLGALDGLIAELTSARAALASSRSPAPDGAALARLRRRIQRFLPRSG